MEFIRQLLSGRIAKVVIFILLASFAFWGVDVGFFNTRGSLAARVGELEISAVALDNAVQRERFNQERSAGFELRGRILREMVLGALQAEFIREQRLRIGNTLLAENIREDARFQNTEGEFDQMLYASGTRGGRGPDFEEEQRRAMALELLRGAILNTSFVMPSELEQSLRRQRQARDLDYAVLLPETFHGKLQPGDEELEEYYRAHSTAYQVPERVRVSYLELDPKTVPARVKVEEQALRNFYELRADDYSYEEERRSTQVLVRLAPEADEALREQGRERAEELLEAARTGPRSLTELVEDAPDAEDGNTVELNELGLRSRGELPEQLAEVLFEMGQAGDFSEVFEDSRGFLFVRLDEIETGRDSTFENSRDDAEVDYRETEAGRLLDELREQLDDLSYLAQDNLREAAAALELPQRESGWFSRDAVLPETSEAARDDPEQEGPEDDPGAESLTEAPAADPEPRLGERAEIRAAAFAPAVLREGRNSPLLDLEDGRIVVLRVLEHEAVTLLPLEEVRAQLLEDWTRERAEEEVLKLGESLLRRLREGADPEQLAEQEDFEWQRREGVQRSDPELPRAVLRRAFSLARPRAGEMVFDGLRRGDDSYALIALRRVAPVEEIELTSEDLRQGISLLEQLNAVLDWNEWMGALQAETKVTYYGTGDATAEAPPSLP